MASRCAFQPPPSVQAEALIRLRDPCPSVSSSFFAGIQFLDAARLSSSQSPPQLKVIGHRRQHCSKQRARSRLTCRASVGDYDNVKSLAYGASVFGRGLVAYLRTGSKGSLGGGFRGGVMLAMDASNEGTPALLESLSPPFPSAEISPDTPPPVPSASSPSPLPPTPGILSFSTNRVPIRPDSWSAENEAEEERQRAKNLAALGGVTIRRRPPQGPSAHNVGPFQFLLESETNVPQNILEEIVWHKDGEVADLKERNPLASVMKALVGVAPARDFVGALRKRREETGVPALIAEVKKASPSRGIIQPDFDPVRIGRAYELGGAACLSVLTDVKYFQGCFENLKLIREAGVQCPLLCKEFIVDAWQLYYARLHGADAVLLISAVLRDEDLRYMMRISKRLGMAALIEVHTEKEMDRVLGLEGVELIGINNRDLGTFKVDIDNTRRLLKGERGAAIRERGIIVVGESGLFTPADVAVVEGAGCGAVLVGESLVKQTDPCAGIAALFGKDISRRCSDAPLVEEAAAPLPA